VDDLFMNLAAFIETRRPQWKELEALLEQVEGSGLRSLDDAQAVEFARLYRCTASDLNQAQTFVAGDATVTYLNDLVARCYLVIHARERASFRELVRVLFLQYPLVFRRYFRHFAQATLILTVGAVFGFVASYFDRTVARGFLLPADMPMIQPGQEGGAMSTGELAGFSGFLFRHNVSVTLAAFALGLTLGIGTFWLLFENGVLLGVLAAVFIEAGELTAFCTGVLPHGVLEIPAILLGGAGGFLLAQGLIRAMPWPRREELARTGKEALWLVSGCVPLLAAAAVLEAVVARAPDALLNSGFKLVVAGLFGVVFVTYILLVGWKLRR
jgi:uncharacterized membrane protein SpoIIM required for sporulation